MTDTSAENQSAPDSNETSIEQQIAKVQAKAKSLKAKKLKATPSPKPTKHKHAVELVTPTKDEVKAIRKEIKVLFPRVSHPKKAAFLMAYAECGNMKQACFEIGVEHSSVYYWRDTDDYFAAAFEKCKLLTAENLEGKLIKQALNKDDAASVTAAIFLLKGAYPQKYRDNVNVEHDFSDELLARFNRGRARLGEEPIAIGHGSTKRHDK